MLLLFTSAEEAQNLISLVASIWASLLHFLLFYNFFLLYIVSDKLENLHLKPDITKEEYRCTETGHKF